MYEELMARDLRVNWHPYTQMKTAYPVPIVKGEGAAIYDAAGKRYIDAVSSWWVTLHGHAHPYIAKKVYEQLTTLEQVIFAGFTHPNAITLSERLLALLPDSQQKAFYTDNGSTAVEVALKMCLQFHHNRKCLKRKILAFNNGYHGDTFGAMSVSSRGVWTAPFQDQLFEVVFIDVPTADNLEVLKQIITREAADIACFIYEPLVQGAAGMLMHSAEYLSVLMAFCRENGILLVQDEVFVGFGRTGELFAVDHLTEVPDVMCFSKGLTGGTMPLGMTTCTQDIYEAFYSNDKTKALFHGHSFTASPLACAAALASLDLLLQDETQQNIQRIIKQHEYFSVRLRAHPGIRNVRQQGTILAMECVTVENTSYFNHLPDILYPFFLDHGVLIRPLGNIIYLVPPYCINEIDLEHIYATILKALEKVGGKLA